MAGYGADPGPTSSQVDWAKRRGNARFGTQAERAEVHGQLFQGPLRGTRIEGRSGGQAVRFICPHVALVHSSGGLRRPGESEVSPEQNSVQTFVLVKRGDRWSIAAFQNTRVQTYGPPGGRGG